MILVPTIFIFIFSDKIKKEPLSLVVSVVVVPHPSPALPCLLVSTYPCAQTSHVAPVSGPDKGQSCALPRVASPFPHPWPDRGELCMLEK
jgi:hypothetical protein